MVDFPSELADALSALVGRRDLSLQQWQNWLAGSATGGPDSDGLYPVSDSTGFDRLLPSPAKMQADYAADMMSQVYIFPDEIDPLAGSGSAHDDTDAIQEMFYAQLTDGRIPALRPGKVYTCPSKIIIDPSRNSLFGNHSIFDFSQKAMLDPAAQTQLVANSGMDSSGAALWVKGTGETGAPPVFNGAMVHTPAEGVNEFMERGQKITAPLGSTLRVTIKVNYLRSHTVGINTFRDFLISFRKDTGGSAAASIGTGGNAGVSSWTYSNNSAGYADGVIITRDFAITDANPYLRIQSAAELSIDYIEIRRVPDNVCMLFETASLANGGQLRGHNYREFRNFKIRRTAGQSDAAFAEAIVMDTPYRTEADDGFHSRANFYNMDISDGIGVGVTFGNRSYLSNFFASRIVTAKKCIATKEGTHDAGENIAFFGGNMGGGDIAIYNPGNMELHLFGTSLDFSRQWIVSGGGTILNGCHLETNQSTQVGPLIDVLGGHVSLRNTKLQCNGSTDAILETPFRVAKGGFLDIETDTPYNLHGTSGALCSGEGRFRFVARGGIQRQADAIAKRDADHNVFGANGAFDGTAILIPAFMRASATQLQVDRFTIAVPQNRTFTADVEQGQRALVNTSVAMTSGYSQADVTSAGEDTGSHILPPQASGSFTGTTAAGKRTITGVSPAPTGTLVRGRYLSGAGIPIGARVVEWDNAAATVTMDTAASAGATVTVSTGGNIAVLSQPWNGESATGATVNVRLANPPIAGMELSTAQARSGTQSLRIFKGAGYGTEACLAYIAVPVEPDRAIGAEFWYKVPASGSGAVGVFIQAHFVQLVETGGLVPEIAPTRQFISDQPQSIDRAVGVDWTRIFFSTNRADATSEHDTYAPVWATHALISINLTSAPSGFEMFIDDLHGNSL